jgi:hypothetical protein
MTVCLPSKPPSAELVIKQIGAGLSITAPVTLFRVAGPSITVPVDLLRPAQSVYHGAGDLSRIGRWTLPERCCKSHGITRLKQTGVKSLAATQAFFIDLAGGYVY